MADANKCAIYAKSRAVAPTARLTVAMLQKRGLFFFDLNDLVPLVSPTVGAYKMGRLVLIAVVAANKVPQAQGVMRTTAVAAAAGNFSLR